MLLFGRSCDCDVQRVDVPEVVAPVLVDLRGAEIVVLPIAPVDVRVRHVAEHFYGHRVQAVGRDYIAGERLARAAERDDGAPPLAGQQRRPPHLGDARSMRRQPA